jgi:hypothetical protein
MASHAKTLKSPSRRGEWKFVILQVFYVVGGSFKKPKTFHAKAQKNRSRKKGWGQKRDDPFILCVFFAPVASLREI